VAFNTGERGLLLMPIKIEDLREVVNALAEKMQAGALVEVMTDNTGIRIWEVCRNRECTERVVYLECPGSKGAYGEYDTFAEEEGAKLDWGLWDNLSDLLIKTS
jgi:TusA-related sulfurtransferase